MKRQRPERGQERPASRRQAESIFFAALEQAGDERVAFVRRRCAGDSQLERTVLSLLQAHEETGLLDRLEGERSRWREELLGPEQAEKSAPRSGGGVSGSEEHTLTADLLRGERYRIHRLLGRGGMGEVWHAYDLKLRLDVALKSVRPDFLAEPRALELLRREVRAAREVVSPNVCRVFDLHELEGRELISMEYVDGTTLREVLDERGPLELDEAREIASQFLAGLGAIHDAGLVHRDIKPDNLMITQAGRVVIMDFGITRVLREGGGGGIAGTPAYMSPEQRSGSELDARADLFSVGVVLAEMVEPAGVRSPEQREAVWERLHRSVPQAGATPWGRVIEKAVDPDREARFASAASLARALDEVTLRAAGDESARPYPGLSSFEVEDARFFFGRELDVESLLRKLRPPRLLGVIGPSGAGKSSFLRAGLLAHLSPGWSAVLATPGTRPFVALARALAEVLPKEAGVVDSLLRFEEPAAAMALISAWRAHHDHCLIVLDQFEELFTQCPRDVQTSFAELLGRIPVEADVHVLLSMRDDFLVHCQSQEPLTPLFSELTPIGPPTGAALRKAIVEPARRCGYHLEDEALVEEMLAEVEGERGSLPMVAFAAAQLWELRDTREGTLTREAYERIGGVSGALAQHAERTLAEIGHSRATIVRELFRNLVTAQGTRVARTRHELLSVFEGRGADSESDEERPSREDAARVLDSLVDARLLTSFEVAGAETDEEHRTQVEIVHESLLTSWPRLQRWRAQEAENAEMRDQLRQAAQSWTSRGRPDDLLWSGTLFQEFELWRQRYPGGLTSEEQEYAHAMAAHAGRVRHRRRALVVAVVSFLIVSLLVVFGLWRQAAAARDQSTREALRAESKQLLALGRLALEDDPTAALSYATASLARQDDEGSRRLALEALSQGPVAQVLDDSRSAVSVGFSPDGTWLAVGFGNGELELWSSRGERTSLARGPEGRVFYVEFGPDSRRLLSVSGSPRARHDVRLLSLPDGEVIWEIASPAPLDARISKASRRVLVLFKQRDGVEVQAWPFDEGTGERITTLDPSFGLWATWGFRWNFAADPSGDRVAFAAIEDDGRPGGVELLGIAGAKAEGSTHLGEAGSTALAFDSAGARLASARPGEVLIWSLDESGEASPRLLRQSLGLVRSLAFDHGGELLAAANETGGYVPLWRLEDPPDAAPIAIRRTTRHLVHDVAFDPGGRWLASVGAAGVAVYPVERRYAVSLTPAEEGEVTGADFLPDGTAVLVTSKAGTLRRWSLAGDGSVETLLDLPTYLNSLDVGPDGRRVLVGSAMGRVWLVDLDGSEVRSLGAIPEEAIDTLALGSRYAAVAWDRGPDGLSTLLWDLETGRSRTLVLGEGSKAFDYGFLPDDTLVVADGNGIHLWRPTDETVQTLSDKPGRFDLSADGRWLLAARQGENDEAVLYDLETGSRRQLDRHGPAIDVALGASGRVAVTLGEEIRVGSITGEEPHRLVGSPRALGATFSNRRLRLRASPDGQWISTSAGHLVLWPVPDLSVRPLHSLPHAELLDKLRSLTNLRVVEDPEAASGWGFVVEPFSGWEEVPTW